MKKSNILRIIGIVIFITAPLYQLIDGEVRNVSGDGYITTGEHTVFNSLLGSKTTHYIFFPSYGWEEDYVIINPPKWMLNISGVDEEEVKFGGWNEIKSWDGFKIALLRWIVKLLIPGVFLIAGWGLGKLNM